MSTQDPNAIFEALRINPLHPRANPSFPAQRHNSFFGVPCAPRTLLARHANTFLGLPAFAAAATWAFMMIYFQIYFLNLSSKEDGSWPRIGLSYAAHPFISCIGAIRKWCFRIVSIAVASLLTIVFTTDFIIGSRRRSTAFLGSGSRRLMRATRIGKILSALVSNAFLIALSFASVNDKGQHDHHLIFVTIQIFGMGMARIWDWLLIREMIRWPALNNDRALLRSRAIKKVEGAIALPASMAVLVAVYGCSAKNIIDGESQFSRKCWSLLSYAAVFEWALSWAWNGYMCTLGYDLMNIRRWVALMEEEKPELPRSYLSGWMGGCLKCFRRQRSNQEVFQDELEDWRQRKEACLKTNAVGSDHGDVESQAETLIGTRSRRHNPKEDRHMSIYDEVDASYEPSLRRDLGYSMIPATMATTVLGDDVLTPTPPRV